MKLGPSITSKKLKIKTKSDFGNFQAISPFRTHKNNYPTDLLEILVHLKPSYQKVFIELKRYHDYRYGVCSYPIPDNLKEIRSGPRQVFSRAISSLTKAKLIKKIPVAMNRKFQLSESENLDYMLNPYLVFCTELDYSKTMWDQIT